MATFNFAPPSHTSKHVSESNVFVPLLLAATGFLEDQAHDLWKTHPAFAELWSTSLPTLASAPPVSLNSFLDSFHAAVARRRENSDARIVAAHSDALATRQDSIRSRNERGSVTLKWLVQNLVNGAGYIVADAQVSLFESFGGSGFCQRLALQLAAARMHMAFHSFQEPPRAPCQ